MMVDYVEAVLKISDPYQLIEEGKVNSMKPSGPQAPFSGPQDPGIGHNADSFMSDISQRTCC